MRYFIQIFQDRTKYFYIFIALLFSTCDASSIKKFPPTNMQEYIDANKDFDIEIVNEKGKIISLKKRKDNFTKNLYGNIVIVIFSTIWCPSCPSVLREFDNLLNKIRKKNIKHIKIIALNIGDADTNRLKIHYKSNDIQLLDVYKSVDNSVTNGIQGVPACLVFNTKNKLVWGYLGGGIDFSSDEFLDSLEALGNNSPS